MGIVYFFNFERNTTPMKAVFTLLALCLSHTLYAQSSWKPLGGNGGLVSDTASARSVGSAIATDSAGTPYVAYTDVSDSLRLIIKKFNGTNWVDVGNLGYHLRSYGALSIVVSSNDTLYVGYYNCNDSNNPTVIKFDGTNWVQVGNSISKAVGMYLEISLAVDSNEKLYFGYGAYSYSTNPPGKANIFTFDGTDWVSVGNTDFVQYSGRMSLRIGLNNELYVGYNTYYLTGHTATSSWVQKWDGSRWDTVGTGFRYITNIDIAPDGTVYTLHEGATSGSGWYAVEKLVNNVWVQLGSTAIYDYGWEIKVDRQGIPYVVFSEAGTPNTPSGVSVKKYDGNSWIYIGKPRFAAWGWEARVAFNKGLPYIVCENEISGQPLIEQIHAWYFDSVATSITPIIVYNDKINIYPNPITDKEAFIIEIPGLPKDEYDIILYNSLGEVVYKQRYQHNSINAVITLQPKLLVSAGIYYLRLGNKKLYYTKPVIVQ